MSAIKSIQGDILRKQSLIYTIYQCFKTITDRGKEEVHLVWCPLHCSTKGTKEADKVANVSALITTSIALHLPKPSCLKASVKD